jgi:hypothetical protein
MLLLAFSAFHPALTPLAFSSFPRCLRPIEPMIKPCAKLSKCSLTFCSFGCAISAYNHPPFASPLLFLLVLGLTPSIFDFLSCAARRYICDRTSDPCAVLFSAARSSRSRFRIFNLLPKLIDGMFYHQLLELHLRSLHSASRLAAYFHTQWKRGFHFARQCLSNNFTASSYAISRVLRSSTILPLL